MYSRDKKILPTNTESTYRQLSFTKKIRVSADYKLDIEPIDAQHHFVMKVSIRQLHLSAPLCSKIPIKVRLAHSFPCLVTISHQPHNGNHDQDARNGIGQEAELEASSVSERQREEAQGESKTLSSKVE